MALDIDTEQYTPVQLKKVLGKKYFTFHIEVFKETFCLFTSKETFEMKVADFNHQLLKDHIKSICIDELSTCPFMWYPKKTPINVLLLWFNWFFK